MLKYFSSARFIFNIITYFLILVYSIIKVVIQVKESTAYWIIIIISSVVLFIIILIILLKKRNISNVERKNIQSIIIIFSSILRILLLSSPIILLINWSSKIDFYDKLFLGISILSLSYSGIRIIVNGIGILYRVMHSSKYLILDEKKKIRNARISELIFSAQINLREKYSDLILDNKTNNIKKDDNF